MQTPPNVVSSSDKSIGRQSIMLHNDSRDEGLISSREIVLRMNEECLAKYLVQDSTLPS